MAKPVEKKDRKTLGIKVPNQSPAKPPEPKAEPEVVNAGVLHDAEEEDMEAIQARIEALVAGIGTDAFPDSCVPRPKNRNNGEEAAEYVTADIIARAAEKRKKAATEAADKAGVFGDRSTYKHGQTKMVYNTPDFTISMKVGNPSKAVNKENTEHVLFEMLPREKAVEAFGRCMKERAAPTQVVISLK